MLVNDMNTGIENIWIMPVKIQDILLGLGLSDAVIAHQFIVKNFPVEN
jgi:hypothetical protein